MRTTLLPALMTLIFVSLAGAPFADAQMSDTDVLQQLRADVQADRQAVVAANLELTDDQGQKFWPVYREYRADMAKVGDRLQKLIQDYAEIYDAATDAQAKAMVNEMMAVQHDQLKVKEKYLPKFRKVLPEVKVAQLLQIENKVDSLIAVELASSIPLVTASN